MAEGFVYPACAGTDDCTIGPRQPSASFNHGSIKTGSGRKTARHPAFKWVNTTLGNIKNAIAGIYRTLRKMHTWFATSMSSNGASILLP